MLIMISDFLIPSFVATFMSKANTPVLTEVIFGNSTVTLYSDLKLNLFLISSFPISLFPLKEKSKIEIRILNFLFMSIYLSVSFLVISYVHVHFHYINFSNEFQHYISAGTELFFPS